MTATALTKLHPHPGRPDWRHALSILLTVFVNAFYQEGPQATIVRQAAAKPLRGNLSSTDMLRRLVAICCGQAPEGRTRWTLRLLAAEMVKRRIVVKVNAR